VPNGLAGTLATSAPSWLGRTFSTRDSTRPSADAIVIASGG